MLIVGTGQQRLTVGKGFVTLWFHKDPGLHLGMSSWNNCDVFNAEPVPEGHDSTNN